MDQTPAERWCEAYPNSRCLTRFLLNPLSCACRLLERPTRGGQRFVEPLALGTVRADAPGLRSRHERLDDVHRWREDDGRGLVPAHLHQRLEITELNRDGVAADHVGCIVQARGGLKLAFGV